MPLTSNITWNPIQTAPKDRCIGLLAGEGSPRDFSVDAAISFIDRMDTDLRYLTTLDNDGYAVIEFEDSSKGLFADITFRREDVVSVYRRKLGSPSIELDGKISSMEIRDLLSNELGLLI